MVSGIRSSLCQSVNCFSTPESLGFAPITPPPLVSGALRNGDRERPTTIKKTVFTGPIGTIFVSWCRACFMVGHSHYLPCICMYTAVSHTTSSYFYVLTTLYRVKITFDVFICIFMGFQ